MAETVIKGTLVKLSTESSTGSGTWSTNVITGFTLTYEAELLDKTVMQSSFRKRVAGLKNWSASIEILQDYTDAEISEKLFNMVGSSGLYLTVRPTSASAAASNPRFHGKVCLESYTPLAGGVGELAAASVTMQGNGSLTRIES
jgi:hypothetical protein